LLTSLPVKFNFFTQTTFLSGPLCARADHEQAFPLSYSGTTTGPSGVSGTQNTFSLLADFAA
jgi:hypothetical protein